MSRSRSSDQAVQSIDDVQAGPSVEVQLPVCGMVVKIVQDEGLQGLLEQDAFGFVGEQGVFGFQDVLQGLDQGRHTVIRRLS